MQITTLIYSLLIIGGITAGGWFAVSSMARPENYNINTNDVTLQSFDKVQNLSSDISAKYSRIQNLTTDKGTNIFIISLIPDALMLTKDLIVLPFSLTGIVIQLLFTLIGFPPWVFSLMISIIGIAVIAAFIRAILGRSP